MNTPSVVILLLVMVHLWICLRERRLTKLARSRLWLTESVVEMEKLMRDGRVANGDVCHDHLYKEMLNCEFATKLKIRWNFFVRPTPEERRRRDSLNQELQNQTEVSASLNKYMMSAYGVYRNSRPIAAFCFAIWALIFGEALLMVVAALLTAIRLHKFVSGVREGLAGQGVVRAFHSAVAAWFVIMNGRELDRE